MSLMLPILEYGASYRDPYRDGQMNALDRVQKIAAKFANHTKDSGWETLAERRNIARICALFKAYTGERACKSVWDMLKEPCYLSRDEHDRKIKNRKKRPDVGK